MVSILNYLVAFLLVIWTLVSLSGYKVIKDPFDPIARIRIAPLTRFLTMSGMTAVVFLGPISIVKYGWWIILLIILGFKDFKYKINWVIVSYLLFLAWALYSAVFIAPYKGAAFNMLIKYALPLGYLYLGYNAITDEEDLVYFMKRVSIAAAILIIFVGGVGYKLLTPIYFFLGFKTGLLLTYGAFADFISAIFVLPISMYIITGKFKWLLIVLLCASSTILENVRTGMGGLFLASTFMLLGVFKSRSLIWIAVLIFIGLTLVFSIPPIREKMFVDKDQTLNELSMDNANFETINSNNREFMWSRNLTKFYEPHPLKGSGLGIAVETLKKDNINKPESQKGLELLHSDYVQFLCDLGLIGLGLFTLFGVSVIIWILRKSWHKGSPFSIKLCGGMALGAFAAIFFSMAYDNIITYAQQCYVFPFIYLGILMRFHENEISQKELSLKSLPN